MMDWLRKWLKAKSNKALAEAAKRHEAQSMACIADLKRTAQFIQEMAAEQKRPMPEGHHEHH